MAASTSLKEIKTKRGTWFVDTNIDNIIGQGAYGIVYRGTDEKGNKIAAKRIDTKRKKGLSGTMKDLDKLMEFDHPNIVKVHDIHEEDGIVWIFMDLCEHGDLNSFFQKKILTEEELVSVMMQIAAGVSYLHDRNIIHRDIKPLNILVSSESPIRVKLTDFDVSKFLDEFFDTSAMSTNVGTLAFKAPEYFIKTEEGKLRYHRNVDQFAMGLTFLAMMQKNGQKKQLIPQIETAQDDSELHSAVGQLIAERMKYKMKRRNIAVVQQKRKPSLMKRFSSLFTGETSVQAATVTEGSFVSTEVRKLIQKLTCVIPEDRLSAAHAVQALQNIALEEKSARQQILEPNLAEVRVEEEMRARQSAERKCPDMKHYKSWETGMHSTLTMCASGVNLLIRGMIAGKVCIRVFNRKNGRQKRDIESLCDHSGYYHSICEHPTEPDHVLEACEDCKVIRNYNINTSKVEIVYRNQVRELCLGPSGTVLSVDGKGNLVQLSTEGEELKPEHSVETVIRKAWGVLFIEQNNTVVFTSHSPGRITAISMDNGLPITEVQQVVGKDIDPCGLCLDDEGRIFVTDRENKQLIVLDSQGLKPLNLVHTDHSYMYDVCWSSSEPQITVLHDLGKMSVISFSKI